MITVERKLLDDRIAESERSARLAYFTYGALLLVVLGLLWAVYRVIRRDMPSGRGSRRRSGRAASGSRSPSGGRGTGSGTGTSPPADATTRPDGRRCSDSRTHEVSDDFDEFASRVHPEDRDRVDDTIEDYLQGRIAEYELEVRLRHKDGTYRWILTRGVALRDDRGPPYRMAGSHTDITARKHAEDSSPSRTACSRTPPAPSASPTRP